MFLHRFGKPKIYLINVSKTGGTSLSHMVSSVCGPGEFVGHYGEDCVFDEWGHITEDWLTGFLKSRTREQITQMRVLSGHLPLVDRKTLPFPVKFCLVLRDPTERLISAFSYSLKGAKLPADMFLFGLHLSASTGDNFENSVAKFFAGARVLRPADVTRAFARVRQIDILGTTHELGAICGKVCAVLDRSAPATVAHLNRSGDRNLNVIPAATLSCLRRRNAIDTALYDLAAGRPTARSGFTEAGPFSSGDHHHLVSVEAAFNPDDEHPWLSASTVMRNMPSEHIGFDFGQSSLIDNVSVQSAMTETAEVTVETSNDNFKDDLRIAHRFLLKSGMGAKRLVLDTPQRGAAWRLRRQRQAKDGPFAIGKLSFGSQPFSPGSVQVARNHVDQLLRDYNAETYTNALEAC